MKSATRPTPYKSALLALGCALAVLAMPAVNAADAAKPATAKAPTLPMTASFVKAAAGEVGPQYVLNLKNDSKTAIKASAKILLSVVAHNTAKAREVPAEVVAPGQVMTIKELASLDKVTVKAEGFAPLELTVP